MKCAGKYEPSFRKIKAIIYLTVEFGNLLGRLKQKYQKKNFSEKYKKFLEGLFFFVLGLGWKTAPGESTFHYSVITVNYNCHEPNVYIPNTTPNTVSVSLDFWGTKSFVPFSWNCAGLFRSWRCYWNGYELVFCWLFI